MSKQDIERQLRNWSLSRRAWADMRHEWQSLDMAGVSLARVDLRHAYLRGANFGGVNLDGADFTEAYLRGASFQGANLVGAVFSGANLRAASFADANLRDADFSRGISHIRRTNLIGADFRRAILEGVYMDEVEAIMANFDGAAFSCTTCGEGCEPRLRGADLTGATFVGADLRNVNFSRATILDIDLKDANLTGATFREYPSKSD